MARRKRELRVASLAFLDIMSCGFGAVVLLFLIIKHHAEAHVAPSPPDLSAEVNLLQEEIRIGELERVRLRNALEAVDEEVSVAQGLARRLQERIEQTRGRIEAVAAEQDDAEVERLQQELRRLEAQKKQLEQQIRDSSRDARTFVGEGDREYLSGLRLGGQRILVLLDASASMLDETIVDVIRRRNMDDAVKLRSPKWRRAVATVDWLSARLPRSSQYQIYTFNTRAAAVLPDTEGRWLAVSDVEQLERAVQRLREHVPGDGTSLHAALGVASRLSPAPDNVYLITDGLPTQGARAPRGATVSGAERLRLFEDAIGRLPRRMSVNVILLPFEGDPMAASAYWQLAQITSGAFVAPAKDWP